ncbi:hypothetical protein SEA_SHROOMS_46 [Arthrobacter phage Shrooms]|nr:hypothetical protein SEA_SHROOMS_46 [Arthrobacter phage Shrooms]
MIRTTFRARVVEGPASKNRPPVSRTSETGSVIAMRAFSCPDT